jgi:hypothetical protein
VFSLVESRKQSWSAAQTRERGSGTKRMVGAGTTCARHGRLGAAATEEEGNAARQEAIAREEEGSTAGSGWHGDLARLMAEAGTIAAVLRGTVSVQEADAHRRTHGGETAGCSAELRP